MEYNNATINKTCIKIKNQLKYKFKPKPHEKLIL